MAAYIFGTSPLIGGVLVLLVLVAVGLLLARVDLADTPPKG